MSGPNHDQDPDDERVLRAAELVLGLTDRDRIADAVQNDPDLEKEIRRWEEDFAQLVERLEPVEPKASAWAYVRAALGNSQLASIGQPARHAARWTEVLDSLAFWRATAGASLAAGAVLGLLWFASQGGSPPSSGSSLFISAILPKDGPPLYVATYDVPRSTIIVVPADAHEDRAGVPRLWLVPNNNSEPIALGPLDPKAIVTVKLKPEIARFADAEAGLVVTLEPADAPLDGASAAGPVIAHGKFTIF
jgi:anti-sigma-K factor RskA